MLTLVFGLVFVLAHAPPAPTLVPLTDADRRKLTADFGAIVRETSPKKRDEHRKKLDAMLKRASFTDLETCVRDAVPGDQWNPGFTHGVKFNSHGDTFTYSVHMAKKKPKGLVPLVLDPGHISLKDARDPDVEDVMTTWLEVAGAPDDVIYVRTRAMDRLAQDGRYDAWSMMQRPKGKENLDTVAAIVLDAIADASRRYPVDPDRVYVHGLSMTGFWAWYLGAFAPDRFAAAVPVSAVTWQVLPILESFRATSVFILHGENDSIRPITGARAAVDQLKQLEIPVDFRPVENGEHVKNTFPRWGSLWPDVAKVTRDPYPKRIAKVFHGPERAEAFWLEARGVAEKAFDARNPTCHMRGAIDGNTITIEADGMKNLRVLLSSQLVDFQKSVTIKVNSKKVFEGMVAPDAEVALEVAAKRGDGGQAYSAAVVVAVP